MRFERKKMSESVSEPLVTDDLEIPLWLDVAFVEQHLRNYYGNSELRVRNFWVRSATAKGENYASSIYRVKVSLINSDTDAKQPILKSIIVKAALKSGIAFETLSAHNVFEKETEFYAEIVPKINELLHELNESNPLVADTFGVCKIHQVMLFDDLKRKGYGVASIQQGFNLEEATIILNKLAMYHGICAVLQERQSDIFVNYKHGAINRNSDVFHTFYYAQIDALIEELSTWPDFKQYAVKLRRIRNDVVEKGCQMFDPNPNDFNTLNHGDVWMNNIMIKRSGDAEPFENVIFIDYQDSCWASPAIDLQYFLNTSLCESLRPDAFNELIYAYHEQLESTLSYLEYGQHIPTQVELIEQFNERNFYGFLAACTIQPFMIDDSDEVNDLETMITNDERSMRFRRIMYQHPKVQEKLRKLIPIFDKLGVFD